MVVDSVLTPACRSKRASLGLGENGIAEEEKEEAEGGGMKAHGEAPEPLLANWGVANGAAYRLDLVVSPQILPSPLFFFSCILFPTLLTFALLSARSILTFL